MDVNPREKCPLTDRRWSRAIITFQVPPKVLFKSRPHTPSRKLQNRRKLTFDLGNHFWVKTQGRNVFGSYNRNMRNGWLHFVVINSISLLELGSLKIYLHTYTYLNSIYLGLFLLCDEHENFLLHIEILEYSKVNR